MLVCHKKPSTCKDVDVLHAMKFKWLKLSYSKTISNFVLNGIKDLKFLENWTFINCLKIN